MSVNGRGKSWQGERVRFIPATPERLVESIASWIDDRSPERRVVGFDGPEEIGTAALADNVAARLIAVGRPAVRVSTRWWWRPASLRLEFGREEVDTLLGGWVDSAALGREIIAPLMAGSTHVVARLRDPTTDRSLREQSEAVPSNAIVLLDGPFLAALELPIDALVHLRVSDKALARRLPPERQWWIPGFDRYRSLYLPDEHADVVVSYDHPSTPAMAGIA
ncbi:MAG TPA: hypothetical protein VES60_01635 [Nakamurella sp.]|nr:hypothetical protein [Nakamurella sp.]